MNIISLVKNVTGSFVKVIDMVIAKESYGNLDWFVSDVLLKFLEG